MRHAPLVISTKLHIPETHDKLVPRHRLTSLLDESLRFKLTLVCAPAGSGKSTLLGQWAKTLDVDVAWVSLDEYDNDVIRFWGHLIAAVDRKRDRLMRRLAQAFESAGTGTIQLLLVQLINELQSDERPLIILLDDYHMIASDELHRSFVYFLERMPLHVHCVLSSRTEPPLPLARFKASGHLLYISGDQLNFTPQEGMDFCRMMHEEIPESYARLLQERTEGWITGMKLALLSYRKGDEGPSLHLIADRNIKLSDYLFEEVYRKLPQEDQRFLRHTSILDMLCAPYCEAVTGEPGGSRTLERLEKANLFLVSLDRKGVWYRYHHLFSEFLRLELERRDAGLIPELRRRAAEWSRKNGFPEHAVEHYLAGGHTNEALDVIGELLPSMLEKQWEQLYRWMRSIPREVLEQRPDLFLAQVFFMTAANDPETDRWIARAEELFLSDGKEPEGEEERTFLSILYLIKALHAVDFRYDADAAIAYMRECVKYASGGVLLQRIEINSGEMRILYAFHIISPDAAELEKFFRTMLELWHNDDPYVFAGFFHVGYGELLYERGEFAQAEQAVMEGWKIARRHRSGKLLAPAAAALAVVYRAQGRHEEAGRLLEETRSQLARWGLAYWADLIHTQQIRFLLADGAGKEPDPAVREWLQRFAGSLEEEEIQPADLFTALTAVRAHIAMDMGEPAEKGLERIERLAREQRRFGELQEARRIRALLRMRQGKTAEALDALEEALAEAERNGTFQPFADEGKEMRRLLEWMAKEEKRKHAACARRVLERFRKEAPGGGEAEPAEDRGGAGILTPKERQVLEMMMTGMPNRLIAQQLHITVGTLKTHINHIYQKLMVSDRWSAINRAREWLKEKEE